MAKYTLEDVAELPTKKRYKVADVAGNKPDVSVGESAVRGFAQGGSFGFADELGAGMGATVEKVADMVNGNPASKSWLELYREDRKRERAKFDAAQEANPKAFLAGEFGGGVATMPIPGVGGAKVAKTAQVAAAAAKAAKLRALAQMAGTGAVYGLGSSDADLTEGDVRGAAIDAGKGAATSAAVGGLFKGGAKLVGAGMESFNPEFWRNIARKSGSRALGYTKRLLKNPKMKEDAEKSAQIMLDEGVITPLASAEKMAERTKALGEKSGKEIGEFLSVQKTGLDPNEAIAALESIRPQYKGGMEDVIHAQIDKAVQTIKSRGAKPLTFEQAQEIKQLFQRAAKWDVSKDTLANETNKEIASTFRRTMDKGLDEASSYQDKINRAMKAAGQEVAEDDLFAGRFGDFLKNKKLYGATEDAAEALENRISSEQGNKLIGLTDTILLGGGGGASLAAGSPEAALWTMITVAGKKGLERFGPQTAASFANKAAQLTEKLPEVLKTNPAALGKFAAPLAQATQRGAEALSVAHNLLWQQDPEYRELMRQLTEGGSK